MAGNESELCASCLRDSEEEGAEFWCNDCVEPLCRGCGKVHRRFANPHGVINLNDVLRLSKNIPKNCKHHEDQNLGFFCVSHDKIICHQCVTENHKNCENIMPIEKAAKNVKESTSIDDLTKRMKNLGEVSKRVKMESEEKLKMIHDEKQKANESFIKLEQCVQSHLTRIKNNIENRYSKTVNTMESNREALKSIEEKVTENTNDLNAVKESTNEKHIFNVVKFLDEVQLNDERAITQMQKDISTELIDIIPTSFTVKLDSLFAELIQTCSEKKKVVSNINLPANKLSQLQAQKINKISSDHNKKSYDDLKSGNNCKYHASCFREDGKIVIVESRTTLEITGFLQHKRISYNIIINDARKSERIELDKTKPNSICMYDKSLALISTGDHLMVVETDLLTTGRVITLKAIENIGVPSQCKWVSCKGREVWVFVTYDIKNIERKSFIVSIDFNGTIKRTVSVGNSISSVDFDGEKYFYCSYTNKNEILSFTTKGSVSSIYNSLDLRETCELLHVQENCIYVLENESNTIYKVDMANQTRTVLKKEHISRPSFFSLNSRTNKLAVTMEDGKLIRIFNL